MTYSPLYTGKPAWYLSSQNFTYTIKPLSLYTSSRVGIFVISVNPLLLKTNNSYRKSHPPKEVITERNEGKVKTGSFKEGM